MLVPDGLLEALIERQILSETGLSLEPFKRHDAFGPEFETELLLSGALCWEVARRYNMTYHNNKGGYWQFECLQDWEYEALHFAKLTLRDWSADDLEWIPDVPTNPPPGAPGRKSANKKLRVFWLNQNAVWRVYKMFEFQCDCLQSYVDVDTFAIYRRAQGWPKKKLPPRDPLNYRPFQSRKVHVPIGPTRVQDPIPHVAISPENDHYEPAPRPTEEDLNRIRRRRAEAKRKPTFARRLADFLESQPIPT